MPVSDGDIGHRRLRAGEAFFKNVTIEGDGHLYFEGVTTSTSTSSNCASQTFPAYAMTHGYYYGAPQFSLLGPAERLVSTSTVDTNRLWFMMGSTFFSFKQYTTEGSTGASWFSLFWGGVNFGASTHTGVATNDLDVGGKLMLVLQTSSTWSYHQVVRSTDVDSNGHHFLVATTLPSTWQ